MNEAPRKQDLRSHIARVVVAKEKELSLWREMKNEIESKWSNTQFAGLLTVTNSWGCLQHEPLSRFPKRKEIT